jgi:hypothetical protein
MRLSRTKPEVVLTLTILALTATVTWLYPLAARSFTRPGDQALVARARSDARKIFHDTELHTRSTFPIVMRFADRTCVELRSVATEGAGSYLVCYDGRNGKKVEERSEAGF